MTTSYVDPFAGGTSVPSVSFRDAPIGATVQVQVSELPELVQSRNFETSQPEFWPDGNPKMSAVVKGMVNGELRSVWAQKPSSLFTAIKVAQEQAGAQIAPGGVLTIRLVGTKPNENPRLHPQKLYEAHYQPPAAFADAPPAAPAPSTWTPPPAQQAPQQPVAPQQWSPPPAPPSAWTPPPAPQAAPAQQQLTTDPAALAAQLGAMPSPTAPGWTPGQSDEPPF